MNRECGQVTHKIRTWTNLDFETWTLGLMSKYIINMMYEYLYCQGVFAKLVTMPLILLLAICNLLFAPRVFAQENGSGVA